MLKLYIYGYRKKIRSSRRLEMACHVNIEVMWLMEGLRPDFKTIADFRKNNIGAMKKVFREFHRRVTVDLGTGFVTIDGSKFKAWNSKDRNFTITKLDDRIQWLEDHSQEYLRLVEDTDWEEGLAGNLTKEDLESKLKETEERLERYRAYRERMEKENLTQLSLTDAEAKLMKNKNGMEISYNVQTAVDSETHMISGYQVTNQVTDHGLMSSTVEEVKEDLGDQILDVVSDKGYKQDEDMVSCLEKGVVPNVILPDGEDAYNLETEYQEAECDPSSKSAEEISKCLHAGIVPEVYKDVIDKMEVVEVRRKVSEEPGASVSPYGTEEEMRERAAEGFYVRDPERDLVYCPGGATLRKKSIKKNGATRYANKQGCSRCPYRDQCLTGKQKWKELDFGKDNLERKAKWYISPEPEREGNEEKSGQGEERHGKKKYHYEMKKVVKFRLKPDRKKMDQRKSISEHVFGTIKRTLGAGYFLLKGIRKVSGEFALMATGYNLARAENMFTFEELMARVGAKA